MLPGILCTVTGHQTPFVFDLAHTGCALLDRSTIQDLLEHVAEYHELECGCGKVVVGRVWRTTAQLAAADPEAHSRNSCADRLPLHTTLESLGHGSQVSLVIATEDSGPEDFLRLARAKKFQSFTSAGATVFRRMGSEPVLPSAIPPSFASICSTPGSVWVDKSDTIQSLLARFRFSWVNVLRRPRGFGKSTLVSMLDAFFDPYTSCAHFPFIFDESIMCDGAFRCRGQLLVFHIDLADLSPYPITSPGIPELEDKCLAFLDTAAVKFYDRYREILKAPPVDTERPGFSPKFFQVLNWAQDQDYQICFLVDNYTAPFMAFRDSLLNFVIRTVIFGALGDCLHCKRARYAFLVGEDAPDVAKLTRVPAHWTDLTDDPAFSAAVGFTSSEVTALGEALSVDLPSALQAALPDAQRGDARLVYSSADVLSLARQLLDLGVVSVKPPPSISVWRMADPPEFDEETRNRIFQDTLELIFGQEGSAQETTPTRTRRNACARLGMCRPTTQL